MTKISKEEFLDWKNHEVTKFFFNFLLDRKEKLTDDWVKLRFPDEKSSIRASGEASLIDGLLDLEYESIVSLLKK